MAAGSCGQQLSGKRAEEAGADGALPWLRVDTLLCRAESNCRWCPKQIAGNRKAVSMLNYQASSSLHEYPNRREQAYDSAELAKSEIIYKYVITYDQAYVYIIIQIHNSIHL